MPTTSRIIFERLVNRVIRNAPAYKNRAVCGAMITRINRLWKRLGSFGSVNYERLQAISAIQDRAAELRGIEVDKSQCN